MGKLPSTLLRRPSVALGSLPTPSHLPHTPLASQQPPTCLSSQVRHATYVLRSRRPYQFTQLVQQSDGSTFTVRTTSPVALYKSDKDTRNHMLWQPTNKSLRNVEVDEAGKLAAFRGRYGAGWDLGGPAGGDAAEGKPGKKEGGDKVEVAATPAKAEEPAAADPFESLVDLISSYATDDKNIQGGLSAKDQARKDKSSKKK